MKRWFSVILCIALLAGMLPIAAAAQEVHWAEPYLSTLAEQEILLGENGQLYPDRAATRAEYCALLNRTFGYRDTVGSADFQDIGPDTPSWKAEAVQVASAAGYFLGAEGFAYPDLPISREEAFVLLARAYRLSPSDAALPFQDGSAISSWAGQWVAALNERGIVQGADGFLLPKASITRAELAKILCLTMGERYAASGVYRPGQALENVTICASGVTLQDAIVNGDLYITEGAASGKISLQNVTVKGRVLVAGAGLSLALQGSVENLMVADRAEGFTVSGGGSIRMASIEADGVVFDRLPAEVQVADRVVRPPVQQGIAEDDTPAPAKLARVEAEGLCLKPGWTQALQAVAYSSQNQKLTADFTYTSGNPQIASVDGKGLVTAVSVGSTSITVTARWGGTQATAEIPVRVQAETVETNLEIPFDIQPDDGQINQFPDMFKFGDTIFVTFSKHMDAAVSGGLNGMRISRDNGRTFDEYVESTEAFIPGNMVQLPNGDLYFVGLGSQIDAHTVRCISYLSKDLGKTWTQQRGVLTTPGETFSRGGAGLSSIGFNGIPMVDEDGVLYNSLYGYYLQDTKYRCLWAKSVDNGLNWEIVSTIASGEVPVELTREPDGYAEPCVVRCADGSLLAVMRTRTLQPLVQCRSFDNGLTWTTPTKLPGPDGQPIPDTEAGSVYPRLLMLSNGMLAMSYGRPDARLLLSSDGCGYRWDTSEITMNAGGKVEGCSGMTGIVETNPGRLLICYDTGAVAYSPAEKSIKGVAVNVSAALPQEQTAASASFCQDLQKLGLGERGKNVELRLFDEQGRLIPEGYTVSYTTDTGAVSVDESGFVMMNRTGADTIRAAVSYQGRDFVLEASVEVVDDGPVAEVCVKAENANLLTGETSRLLVWAENALGKEITSGITWSFTSQDPSIVSVDETGVITGGTKPGRTLIRIQADQNGSLCSTTLAATLLQEVEEPMTFDQLDALPAGFELIFGKTGFPLLDGKNVLSLADDSSASAATLEFVGPASQKKIFEAMLYPQTLDKSFVILMMGFNGIKEGAFQISVLKDGSVNYFTDQYYPLLPAGTIQQGNWYRIRMEADCLGITRLYINGKFSGEIPLRTLSLTTVDRVQLIAGSTNGTRDVLYCDEFLFFTPTEETLAPNTIDAEELPELLVDGQAQIQAAVKNKFGVLLYDADLRYQSQDETVASVDASGNLTGISPGQTTITISAGRGENTLEKVLPVTVVKSDFDHVSLTADREKLIAGEPAIVTAKALTADLQELTAAVTYSSSAPEIAAVDESGRVKGLSAGTAQIEAKVVYRGVEKTASVTITVLPQTDDFESYQAGELPVDFVNTNPKCEVQLVAGMGYNGSMGLKLFDTDSSSMASVDILKTSSKAKKLTMKINLQLLTTQAGYLQMQLKDSSGKVGYQIYIKSDGTVASPAFDPPLPELTVPNGTWCELTMELRPSGSSSLRIRNLQTGAEQTCELPINKAVAELTVLSIQSGRNKGARVDTVYLDDFSFVALEE